MNRARFTWSTAVALCLSLTAASCDHSLNAPELNQGSVQSAVGTTSAQASYTLVRDVLPSPVPLLSLSQIVGIGGGQITLLGHTLSVPAGAVTTPTLFTMYAHTNGYIEVELNATVTNLLGNVLNVGHKGFKKPVKLTMSYARSPDTLNPNRLVIVYINGNKLEPVPSTVNATTKTVTGTLSHFSKYGMASN